MDDEETEEKNNFKIVLIGESGVGKTSIISQYVDQIFDTELNSSIGGSFSSKTLTLSNGKSIKLEIWDTAGQERYRALTKIFYKDALACVLVFDITKKNTFEELRNYWIHQVKESAPEDIILAIAANKSDLIDKEEVDEKESRQFAEENNALYFTTSAKNSVGINELFMGIGKKFYKLEDDVKIEKEVNVNSVDKEEKDDINISIRSRTDTVRLRKEIKSEKNDEENQKGCC